MSEEQSDNGGSRNIEIHVKESCINDEDLNEIYSTIRRSIYVPADDEHDNGLPGLVLAVIGDSESYVPKPWNTTALTSGLLQSTQGVKKCWVIYRGNNDGISALIYKTFRETTDTHAAKTHKEQSSGKTKENILIAIRPWTKTNAKDVNKVNGPDLYLTLKPVSRDVQEQRNYRWFNLYLSHFLKKLSAEYTPLMLKEKHKREDLINMRVPVLVIAVEGDISTIHQINSAVKRNIPVLLMKGSGKAVDFIIDYLEESRLFEKEKVLKENAPLLLGIYMRLEEYKMLKKRLKSIQEHSYLITIFDLNNSTNDQMEEFIVKAIIKGWSMKDIKNSSEIPNDPTKIPAKTVTMNNVQTDKKCHSLMEKLHITAGSLSLYFYIAYQYIQESGAIQNKEKELELFLLEAIIANRVDYVSTLLQHGVQFDRNYMIRLFDETLKCNGCDASDCRRIHDIHIRVSMKCCDGIWCTCYEHCKKIRLLCNEETCEVYHDQCQKDGQPSSSNNNSQPCKCSRHNGILTNNTHNCRQLCDLLQNVRNLCQKLLHYPKDSYGDQAQTRCSGVSTCCRISTQETAERNEFKPYHVLLAWAIFAQREDLASILWSKCENPLLTAIMASSILRTMADMVNTANDLKLNNDLLKHSRLFEKRALFLMNSLYEEDATRCMSLMNTESRIWGIRVAPVECAFDNGMIDVIGHPCVQRLLNRVWYKDTASMWRNWLTKLFCFDKSKRSAAWTSPAMVFMIHYLLMLGILGAYSAFLLSNVKGVKAFSDIGLYELLLYLWITADAIEEIIRNILITVRGRQSRKWFRLKCYLTNIWSVLALLLYAVLVSAVLVRTFDGGQRWEIRLYSLGLFIIYMRFFHSFMVHKYFGLKLIMIGKMLSELLQFSWILIVFVVCAGVMYHSNMYPNHRDMWPKYGADVEHWRIWKILALPYWQLYGEISLDMLNGETNSNGTCTFVESEWERNSDLDRCVEYDWAIMVIAAMYMLISNLLLINLIIALFSYRFEEVQNNSDRLWKYGRYAIITDYSTRYPVPFNVFGHVFNFCNRIRQNGKTGNNTPQEQENVLRKCIDACSFKPETLGTLQEKYATIRLYSEITMNSKYSD
ncbi:transient receptor potential cation channel subfamily M member 2-like [Mytilus californianus]|uniref:transient receptor potential cation channel subfamily M member 2-like n=1 Tax=Mytilus californianus TaxID=6549 RepID=UPI002248636F|nr:transient receptor potential cation channel subfamily M member 2-like [Mytilus californianus]